MKTAVVILNWNTEAYLRRFLPGLLASCEGMDAEVIVADSASDDGSAALLADSFPGVRAIRLDANYGFTGGYNRALEQVDAQYFVLINSDIEVAGDWLGPLVRWMDSHPDCGVCGPKLHKLLPEGRSSRFEYAGAAGGLIDRYGYPFCRGRVLKRTADDAGQYDSPADVLWVSGACLMTRSSLWHSLNGLDDRFFAHMEEIDYCWRAQLAGWKVTVVPESVVYHIGGGTLAQDSPFKLKLNFRNNLLLLDKNLAATVGKGKAAWRIFVRMMLDGASAAVYLMAGKTACFKAVLDAHSEYRGLRKTTARTVRVDGAQVRGLLQVRILLQSAIRKDRIFNYLTKYEDSH